MSQEEKNSMYSPTEKQDGNCKFFEGLDGESCILKIETYYFLVALPPD